MPSFVEDADARFPDEVDPTPGVDVAVSRLPDGAWLVEVSDGSPWFYHAIAMFEVARDDTGFDVRACRLWMSSDVVDGNDKWRPIQAGQVDVASDAPEGVLATEFWLHAWDDEVAGTYHCRLDDDSPPTRSWYVEHILRRAGAEPSLPRASRAALTPADTRR
ncbi:MAG: hypothetical protein H6825_00040 [Planctomycetes bacterium]|nr:hypothetical protein [Planctomycetota bacterium]